MSLTYPVGFSVTATFNANTLDTFMENELVVN